jgi:hypothetical protein
MNRSLSIIVVLLTAFLATAPVFAQTEAETAQQMREAAENAVQKAAEAKKDSTKNWTINGSFSITANSIMLQHWQAGGANVLSGASLFNITPIYEKDKSSWITNLVLAYGLNRQEGVTFKMDDRIDFQSNYNYNFSDNWNFSSLVSFRTQFFEGFAAPGETELISDFFSPAYAIYGLGVTYKKEKRLIVYMSPFTAKNTFVYNQRLADSGAFGVDPGENFRFELGSYVNIIYREKLNDKINFQTRLDLFSNYFNNPQNIDVNAEILFFWKINKFLSFNAALNLIYDDDIRFPVERPDGSETSGPRTQLKSVLGAGFAYTF